MAALQKAFGDRLEGTGSLRAALTRLRQKEFSAIILDQNLLDADPAALETLAQHFGTASPVYVNLALHSAERVVREVRLALARREAEQAIAGQAAAATLRNDLRDAVTGILLSSQLALQLASLPDEAQHKLRTVCDLAESIRERLAI
jgi:hypothetical protein